MYQNETEEEINKSIIYGMKCHEIVVITKMDVPIYEVMRVPGGWIYRSKGKPQRETFVPFDNEFCRL